MVTAGGGTGPEYFASIILFLRKAQLKEGQEKAGIVVTATPNKNRFAKPTPVKFVIHFSKGMNEYMGLQDYISWENCGIAKGNIIYAKDIDKQKISDKDKDKLRETIWTSKTNGKEFAFMEKETARKYVARHHDDTIDVQELFSSTGFPPDVLKELDDKIIQQSFSYGTNESIADELEAIVESDE
jgi:hypothetical protein